MKKEYDLYWHGVLTIKNVQKVADLLLQLLDGRRYTFVAADERYYFMPKVRTGQRLNHEDSTTGNAISVHYDEKKNPPKHAGFTVCDTHGVWFCSTNLAEAKYDPKFNNPYFVFAGNKVTITQRTFDDKLLYWVVAIEQD